jgi:hypothetical protein
MTFDVASVINAEPISISAFGKSTGRMSGKELQDLEQRPIDWLLFFFPHLFTRTCTFYQVDFWDWVKTSVKGKADRPRVECHPRGVGKSTHARARIVYLLAKKIKYYSLYTSGTDDQAQKHFNAIKAMLESDKLLLHYPHLAPKVAKRTNRVKNWSAVRLVTEEDQVVEFVSLLGNARGFTTEEGKRPDDITADDLDNEKDSGYIIQKKIDAFGSTILGTGTDETDVVIPQNLVHRNSVVAKIKDLSAGILINRNFIGAYPLLKWYDAELINVEGDTTGARRWRIVAGESFDNAVPIEYAEKLLNTLGKRIFDRECQQDVWKVEEDKDFREYDEVYHVITHSEFLRIFPQCLIRGKLQLVNRWHVGEGLDWGTTSSHPAACVSVFRPDKTSPLDDCQFTFAEAVLPVFPQYLDVETEAVSPGRVADAIKQVRREWGILDSQIEKSVMSHEASAALNTFLIDLEPERKVFFGKWKAQRGSGVPQIQNGLEIDYTKNHPFRRYPEGYKVNGTDVSGQPLKGRPREYLLVPDEQGALYVDIDGKLRVYGARDAKGLARLRFEIPLYSHRNVGQHKIDDDAVDGWRGLKATFGVDADALTDTELIEAEIEKRSPSLTIAAMREASPYPKGFTFGQEAARREEEQRIRRELQIETEEFEDDYEEIGEYF